MYEGCGREGPIRSIFLSEFHPVHGSRISCQVKYLINYKSFVSLFIEIVPPHFRFRTDTSRRKCFMR